MTNSRILYLFTRTPLHVGAGSSVGAIDQPIQRERHTGFPIIPGSAIKGVLADGFIDDRKGGTRNEKGRMFFGHENPEANDAKSGSISFAEAKLLALPVRSAKGCFAWITSPLILERWKRDTRAAISLPQHPFSELQLFGDRATLAHGEEVVIEDYVFQHRGDFPRPHSLADCMGDSDTLWRSLHATHLCLINDDMMSHFARNACEVAQHVKIDDESGTASDGALFNQENVPAETLFYSVLTELRPGVIEGFSVPATLQFGGDATTGHGFCTTNLAA
jgi:CRISPR-associated protein Cmr4